MPAASPRRLLLLGAGHTHLQVLRRLAGRLPPDVRVAVMSPHPRLAYSGMIPGWLAGQYPDADCLVDVRHLVCTAGWEWVEDAAIDIEWSRRQVRGTRETRSWDVLSVDVGGSGQLPMMRDATVQVLEPKRFEAFVAGIRAWETRTGQATDRPPAIVAGGGAAAVELALALATRLSKGRGIVPHAPGVIMASAGSRLTGLSPRAARLAVEALARAGAHLRTEARLHAVGEGRAWYADGTSDPASLVIMATGSHPHAWLAAAARREGVGMDDAGFLAVDATLRIHGARAAFAAGDCCTMVQAPVARSGVHAIRQADVLAHGLMAALDGRPALKRYRLHRPTLALLSCADGTAIASFGPLGLHGRWLWRWKDRIDRRFIDGFRQESRQ